MKDFFGTVIEPGDAIVYALDDGCLVLATAIESGLHAGQLAAQTESCILDYWLAPERVISMKSVVKR